MNSSGETVHLVQLIFVVGDIGDRDQRALLQRRISTFRAREISIRSRWGSPSARGKEMRTLQEIWRIVLHWWRPSVPPPLPVRRPALGSSMLAKNRGCLRHFVQSEDIGFWSVGLSMAGSSAQNRVLARETIQNGPLRLLLAKRLASPVMDEVEFGAGRADYGGVTVSLFLWHVCQPMLHVNSGAGAFEQDGFRHG
jgi:hypothetical protein